VTEYDDDDVDAEFVAAVFAAARRWEMVTGKKAPGKVLRETLWFIWQRPRLPRPLVRSKYPATAPWTAAARAVYAQDRYVPGSLVVEHIESITGLIRRLLDDPPQKREFASTLDAGLRFCVVTSAEDKMLAASNVGSSTSGSSDPWVRYRLAGIDVEGIAPLLDR